MMLPFAKAIDSRPGRSVAEDCPTTEMSSPMTSPSTAEEDCGGVCATRVAVKIKSAKTQMQICPARIAILREATRASAKAAISDCYTIPR